jgi:triacylglycerol lipase
MSHVRGMVRMLALLAGLSAGAEEAQAEKCVVLLHGLARGAGSMTVLAQVLRSSGYTVINQDYASTKTDVGDLSTVVDEALDECGPAAEKVNFVTHSMGGIVLRQWVAEHGPQRIGRVVMMGPPNQGSELVDKLGDLKIFQQVNGPAGNQLGTDAGSLPHRLGPVTFELGVLAGTQSLNPVYSNMIPGEDDGKVSVASTRVKGMKDHISLPVTHTFMMNNPVVIAQIQAFLAKGAFDSEITLGDALFGRD